MWDYNKGADNWSNKIYIILSSINCMHVPIFEEKQKAHS